MPKYTQANRPLTITTPLGKDALLLVSFHGTEALSQLFLFHLDLLAENGPPVAFQRIVGQPVTVTLTLPSGGKRSFGGIIRRFTQGRRDDTFTHFRAEMVPQFWLCTKKVQSRIFQHLSVPAILKQVLKGLNVSFRFKGQFPDREYCVQYRESDFAFASRLMEEEGIQYFFQHTADGHQLVVTDDAFHHPDLPGQKQVIYEEVAGGQRDEMRVWSWEKSQELRGGKYTVWDHHFELPDKNLEAQQFPWNGIPAGKVSHQFKLGCNEALEIYDYPGGYAHHFDGVDKAGVDQAAELQKVFQANQRTARVRLEEEMVPGLEVQGTGNCGHFTAGHQFTLVRHYDGDGPYYLDRVEHAARMSGNYRSGPDQPFTYQNRFTCRPTALPYRPPRVTRRPTIPGPQTAVVVGPPGEEILCDKYGRVKVQFHWDRQGKKNENSSCWLRVGQLNAGKGFGSLDLPRIGHEVIVAFLEGDPDQPIIVGAVYNAENMPPYKLPDQRTYSGVAQRSHHGVAKNASEIRFQKQLGSELLLVHAETDSLQQAENNHLMQVGKVHRQEVGQFYHVIVGKPVNVNQAVVAIEAGAAGSGAGGGPTTTILPDGQAMLGIQGGAAGSGAGGGPTTKTLADGTEQDTYPSPGLETDVSGNNATNITGNNSTNIWGDDTYEAKGNATSTIGGTNHTVIEGDDHYHASQNSYSQVDKVAFIFESAEFSFIPLQLEGKGVHLEATGIHVELNGVKLNTDGVVKNAGPLQILAFG
jgi:type VI secretion system secreted protein VgrG